MKKTNKFSPEARERAVRMVPEQRREYLTSCSEARTRTGSQALQLPG